MESEETDTGAQSTDGAAEPAATGQMTVVVAGTDVTAGTNAGGDRFWLDAEEPHTWHASEDVTLAGGLSILDVGLSGDTLRYAGETYDGDANGTTVDVRVNGDPVDPASYTLADGDEVWVTVERPGMNVSTPGTYIRQADQHVHGHLEFVVDGERVDFGRDRYQSNDRFFHFEGNHHQAWHAHSFSITLQYALSSLDGIEVSADGEQITYDGTTYSEVEAGTSITIEVSGEPVVPGDYYLKDWDGISVVVETS